MISAAEAKIYITPNIELKKNNYLCILIYTPNINKPSNVLAYG